MIGIYKIQNKINKKVYIGQSVDIKKRWTTHKFNAFDESSPYYGYPLYRSIRKYGLDNFEFTVVEECQPSELNNEEKYWIKQYKSFIGWKDSWGYNQNPGGDSYSKAIKLNYDKVLEIKELLKSGKYLQPDIANKYNISADMVRRINNGRCWAEDDENYPIFNYTAKIYRKLQADKYWETHTKKTKSTVIKQIYPSKEVVELELKKYSSKYSFTKIATTLGITRRILYRLLKKYNLDSYASNYKKQKIIKEKEVHLVEQYTLDNKLIAVYKSAHKAARAVFNNENLASPICECCNKKRKQFKGYLWKYKTIIV